MKSFFKKIKWGRSKIKKSILIFSLSFCLVPMNSLADDKCLSRDCIDGKGTMKYSDGRENVGQFKNGKPHGQGIHPMLVIVRILISVLPVCYI